MHRLRFDQIAYSLLTFNIHVQNVEKELDDMKSMMFKHNIAAHSALDSGCGDGKITKKMKHLFKISDMYGLDLNKRLLTQAAKRGIKTVRCDANNVNIAKRFDLVISYGTLHHTKNTDLYIRSLKKTSKKYLLLADLTVRDTLLHKLANSKFCRFDASSYPIRSREEIIRVLKSEGFILIDEKLNKNANIWFDRSIFLAKTI